MLNAFRWMVFVIGLAVVISSIIVTSANNPTITIYSPHDGDTVYTETITVSGSASRGEGGVVVESVTVKGYLAKGTTSWRKDISLQIGQNEITAVATDRSGKCGEDIIYVNYSKEPPPTRTPTPTTIPNGGHRPTPTPTPTSTPTPPPTGSISITTIPPGAEVYLDGSFAGNTSITLTLEDVTEGQQNIKVIKEGYRIETREIFLWGGETIKRDIELTQLTGSIAVLSTPSGASVDLDDDYMNPTPCMLCEVVVGQHTIKLEKSGYFDAIRDVSVSADERLLLPVNLTKSGSINISSDPEGAKVYLDGNYTGETTPTNISKVALGNYTINLTKSDYFNETIKPVDVSVAKTYPIHVNLRGYGSINISSDPEGAKVYLDGKYTRKKTPTNISKVAQGNHSIEFEKWGYVPVTENIQVSTGETKSEHVSLSPTLTGIFSRIFNPAGGIPWGTIIIITLAGLIGIIGGGGILGFIKWLRERKTKP